MIQDLHSHTYYSFDSKDTAETVIEAAIAGGVDTFGICDHNYGIAMQRSTTAFYDEERRVKDYQRSLNTYLDHLRLIADKYQDHIRVFCGIEIATLNSVNKTLPDMVDISSFDYCLIEHIDAQDTIVTDIFAYAKRCGTKVVGIAHTDLFNYLEHSGQDPLAFFTRMAENNIFWEMNVNYDSIHHHRIHSYLLDFFSNEHQQQIIRKSGVKLSIGFDGHRVDDYRPDIIRDYSNRIQELELPLIFSDSQGI